MRVLILLLWLCLPALAEKIPLEVAVTQTIFPGYAPPEGQPQFSRSPLVSSPVWVSAAGGANPVLARATTDKHGKARFGLPPGKYWVYVPIQDSKAVFDQPGLLPDGGQAVVWKAVDLRKAGQPLVLDIQVHCP